MAKMGSWRAKRPRKRRPEAVSSKQASKEAQDGSKKAPKGVHAGFKRARGTNFGGLARPFCRFEEPLIQVYRYISTGVRFAGTQVQRYTGIQAYGCAVLQAYTYTCTRVDTCMRVYTNTGVQACRHTII